MTHARRDHTRPQNAQQRHGHQARARLEREPARAPRALEGVEPALQELGVPETVAEAVQWRRRAPQKRVGKIFAVMFPPGLELP